MLLWGIGHTAVEGETYLTSFPYIFNMQTAYLDMIVPSECVAVQLQEEAISGCKSWKYVALNPLILRSGL